VAEQRPIELIAVPVEGTEAGFDGAPLAPGVHLRWSILSELGWPSGGFEVYRRAWFRGEFNDYSAGAWQRIALLNLPPSTGGNVELLRRARTVTSAPALVPYEKETGSILLVCDRVRLRTPQLVEATRGQSRARLPVMDVLQLACLDPYAARGVGLAMIDGEIPPRTPVDYKVAGLWGTGACFWSETLFDSVEAPSLSLGQFDGTACRISTARALSKVDSPAGRTELRLGGMGALELRVLFTTAAREVELELLDPAPSTAVTRWTIRGRSGNHSLATSGSSRITLVASGATLRITSPPDKPLDELVITDTLTSFSTWRMTLLRQRRLTGAIGRLESGVVCVSRLAAMSVPEPHVDVAFPPPAVVTPLVTSSTFTPAATELADDGRIRPASALVEALLAPIASPDALDLTRPARVHAGYVRASPGSRTELTTRPLPTVGQTFSTVGFWRLDGTLAGLTGPPLVQKGTVSYVDDRPAAFARVDMRRRTVRLTGRAGSGEAGPGYLEASNVPGVDGDGTTLHLQLWVWPVHDPEPYPTLVGNNYKESFWFGLTKLTDAYRLRFWVNHQLFESARTIPLGDWSHVAVHYDGEEVHFFVNGQFDVSRAAPLGWVRANPRHRLCIGCDPIDAVGTTPVQPYAYPFAGYLADVQVRRGVESAFVAHHLRAGWLFDGDLRDRKSGVVAAAIGPTTFVTDHPETPTRRALRVDGATCVVNAAHPLADPGRRLCVKLRLKPDAGQTTAVILGTAHWKLSLRASGTGYQAVLRIGSRTLASTHLLAAGRWGTIVAGADGDRAYVYVNGRPTQAAMLFGKIPRDPDGAVTLCADAASRAGAIVAGLRGVIADVDVGDTLPAPAAPSIIIDQARTAALNDPFATDEDPPAARADLVARHLEPGTYRQLAQGVDLFGRNGAIVTGSIVTIPSTARPLPAGGAKARFLPVLGSVSAVTPPDETHPWIVDVTTARPATLPTEIIDALRRHVVEIADVVPDGARQRIAHAESCEIVSAGGALRLDTLTPALPRLRPAVGQRVSIAHDRWVRVEWTWTGTQRILAPHVARFWLWERRKTTDAWTDWAALADRPVVTTDVALQDEAASNLPPSVVTYADWLELRENGVVSLPEPADPSRPADGTRRPRSRIFKVILPVRDVLAADASRISPQTAPPGDFVPGALVAYNTSPTVQAWQLFTVLWHTWNATTGWTLYFVENSKGREAPPLTLPVLVHARYYPGQRYRVDAPLATAIDFGGRATVPMEISIDTTGTTSVERSTDLVAIDYRRPPEPPPPVLELGPADVTSASRARITWTLPPPVEDWAGVMFQVYRASDAAVFARDLEQRRRSQEPSQRALNGHYAAMTPEEVMADDLDFIAWLTATFPEWATEWTTRLFVPKPAHSAAPADEPAWTRTKADWSAASTVWQAWADRFYPALRAVPVGSARSQIQELAERDGNEAAFGLMNDKAVDGIEYVGSVNGAARNHHLARLRGLSKALAQSTRWSRVSAAVRAPSTRAPAQPVFTAAVSGNREIALTWELPDDPDVVGYRLYRARSVEELRDLRWWTDALPERRVFELPDPRLRVVGNAVTLPAEAEATEILSVVSQGAFNHYRDGRSFFDHETRTIRELSPLREGAAVVVTVRTITEAVLTLGATPAPMYVDLDLPSLGDYHYRLEAVGASEGRSPGSKVVMARSVDTRIPDPPRWIEARPVLLTDDGSEAPGGTTPAMRLVWESGEEGATYIVTKKARDDVTWRPIFPNAPPRPISAYHQLVYDHGVVPGTAYTYRIKVLSAAGVPSETYRIIDTRRN
jgi:hypothetical protein